MEQHKTKIPKEKYITDKAVFAVVQHKIVFGKAVCFLFLLG